ncbi:MAG: hypothetical protein EPO68_04375 [Planctomycetota bacterium]|nr:MAG: hypothetical protein EPO68_04375 [Planctomycetota bacterium]
MRSVRFPLAVLAVALALGACAFLLWSPRPVGIASAAPEAGPARAAFDGPSGAELESEPAFETSEALVAIPEPPIEPVLASDRRAADVAPLPSALRVTGRAVDLAGRPIAALGVVALAQDADSPNRDWSTQAYLVRARAPTDAQGRFELWVESTSFARGRSVALRLACLGEQGFGGPDFKVVAAGVDSPRSARNADSSGRFDAGDLVLRASDRFVCSGRYELVEGGAVASSEVKSSLRVDGAAVDLRWQNDEPGEEGALLLGNERGEFALYVDRVGGRRFELTSSFAERPQPAPLAVAAGATGLRVVFEQWASVRGMLLTDFGAQQTQFKIACRYEPHSIEGNELAARVPSPIDASGRFELSALPAGRCAVHVVAPRPGLDGGAIAELDLRWGESRDLGVLDLRGEWAVGRLDVRDAHGRPATGWAVVEPGDGAPFGFMRELATALPRATRRVHVYVPGHRIATVVWPPRDEVLELEAGPLLDLGFGACGPCCVNDRGLDVELEPVSFEDASARHFASVMRLLPLSCERRASVRLPCAGTYRLSYKPQRRSEVAALTRSYDIDVPVAGRSFDP